MKALVLILTLIAFVQSTILPLDLVLIVLILRAYIKPQSSNYYLAFGIGLLTAFLNNLPLGSLSVIYLFIIYLSEILSKIPISKNIFSVIPLIFLTVGGVHFVESLIFHQTPNLFPILIIEGLLSLPAYLLIRFWEERFVVRSEVKLKI